MSLRDQLTFGSVWARIVGGDLVSVECVAHHVLGDFVVFTDVDDPKEPKARWLCRIDRWESKFEPFVREEV